MHPHPFSRNTGDPETNDHHNPNMSVRNRTVRSNTRSSTQVKEGQWQPFFPFLRAKKSRSKTIMIELFDLFFAITSVLSVVTCTIWCNKCILEWQIRRRLRRRNPAAAKVTSSTIPIQHTINRYEVPMITPKPEHIYMEIDMEQPAPCGSTAPPPYTRVEATQISYI